MQRLFAVLALFAAITVAIGVRPAHACNAGYESCLQDANPQRQQCFDDAETWLGNCSDACDFQWPVPPGCHANCWAGWQGMRNQCEWNYAGAECACNFQYCGGQHDVCF